jgi:hypothetical protein
MEGRVTLGDLLRDEVGDQSVYDYRLLVPISMDDEAEVEVVVEFGVDRPEYERRYMFEMRRRDD